MVKFLIEHTRGIAGGPPPAAITLGNWVFFFESESYKPSTPEGLAKVVHELAHVQQWKQEGYLGFARSYLEQLRSQGYEEVVYEQEARKVGELVEIYLINPKMFIKLIQMGEIP